MIPAKSTPARAEADAVDLDAAERLSRRAYQREDADRLGHRLCGVQ
jgi:hypothetical protein